MRAGQVRFRLAAASVAAFCLGSWSERMSVKCLFQGPGQSGRIYPPVTGGLASAGLASAVPLRGSSSSGPTHCLVCREIEFSYQAPWGGVLSQARAGEFSCRAQTQIVGRVFVERAGNARLGCSRMAESRYFPYSVPRSGRSKILEMGVRYVPEGTI